MRKKLFALLVGILAVTLLLTACAGVNLTLTFEVDGEAYATVITSGQEAVQMPKDPTKEGYVFDGWYWDKDVWEKPFTVNSLLETPLTESMTVYAKWKKEAEEHVHSYGEWTVTTAATCTTEGTEKRVCECGEEETRPIEKLPHSFGEWTVETAANCTTEGLEKRVCDICMEEDMRATSLISHNYNINNDEINHWLECSVCSNKKDKEQHTYENDVCTVCGSEYVTIGLEYKEVSGGYEVAGIGTAEGNKIVFPSTYEGEPVIGIGSSAFYNCRSIVSVEIPKSITSIGSYAFSGCSSLISIEIPTSVTSIRDRAFDGCSSLTKVEISDIAAWCGIEFSNYANPLSSAKHLYLNGEEVTELVIPEGVTSIGVRAFYGCSSLISVVIPNSVTNIGKNAFYGCGSLESITIPYVGATKDGTSDKHFGYIFGATNVGNNSEYVPKTLKTVIITGGTSIGSNAFGGCSSLVNIEIPNSVTSIGSYAFSGCSSLISIEIPKNITNIGEQTFRECRSIESIEYGGTKAEWKAIEKGSHWNYYTGNYTVTCTDGTLSKEESKL